MSTNEWVMSAWRNEIRKEQTSLKREAENVMINVNALVEFNEGSVIVDEERYTEWKIGWKKLKRILSHGQKRNKQQSFAEKALQSEIPKQYVDDDYEWLKCNTDPRKTASIFVVQEQMVETKAW